MNLPIKKIYKPEYFYQPSRLIRRLGFKFFPPKNEMQFMELAWGRRLMANPHQTIGYSLYTFGLYDLALSEMIFRLVSPGDTVLDVGANVGYTTSLMLDRLSDRGRLFCFEPLPELFKILEKNISATGSTISSPQMIALSDREGDALITLPESFSTNDGVATLEPGMKGTSLKIRTNTIDSLGLKTRVKLMKIDVEGHELSVLKGAHNSLDLFENIIFEDLQGAFGPTSLFLEARGFMIYKIVKGFSGLTLEAPSFKTLYSYEPDNFLATKDPHIQSLINEKKSWQILGWKV